MNSAAISILLGVVLALSGCQSPPSGTPRNVILFVGDGMGPESIKAGSLYATGTENGLSFQAFPHQAVMTHHSANRPITDSAASATAMATGVKVDNGVISVRLPGDGSPLPTLLELYKSQGKSVGLVTTTFVEDATPAAFAAHQRSRGMYTNIADDYLQRTRPDLVMGGYSHGGFEPAVAAAGGYQVVTDRDSMNAVDSVAHQPLAGLFKKGIFPSEFDGDYTRIPHLSEMTSKALTLLEDDPDGFFLLVENENIDESNHHNNIEGSVSATAELSKAVRVALDWAADRQDTLMVVLADHETGGLRVLAFEGQGRVPQVSWKTYDHTATPVRVFARGPLAEGFQGQIDNTDVVRLLTGSAQIEL